MKISVALCTYNGQTYLQEQLDSYLAQTRLPDELIVCDDGSTDLTREILTVFANAAPFPVKLHFNEQNLGYTQNFGKAAALSTGDIIVFSDQDDVWRADKLELIEAEFNKSENVGVVYADAELVDENLCPLGMTMWQCNNFNSEKQKHVYSGDAINLSLKDGYVLGSSMAFSGKFQNLTLPLPPDIYFDHDDWITLLISAVADVVLINEPLIKYRQHSRQTSDGMIINPETGLKPLLRAARKINKHEKVLNQLIIAEKRLTASRFSGNEAITKIVAAKEHIAARVSLTNSFPLRLVKIWQELKAGRYHAYSNGFRSAAKDLFIL